MIPPRQGDHQNKRTNTEYEFRCFRHFYLNTDRVVTILVTHYKFKIKLKVNTRNRLR
jgi:hypothetical protein